MKSKMMLVYLILLVYQMTIAAGGWAGGGGQLIRDAINPWFLPNTSEVKYCIVKDDRYFTIQKKRLNEIIKESFDYWNKEFRKRKSQLSIEGKPVEIATQRFYFENKCEDADIKFQFGVLEADQRKYVPIPKETFGAAVRTQYDRKRLKGSGFIYISPEKGPLKVDYQGIVSSPWKMGNNEFLKVIVFHEVGHIFGLPDYSYSWSYPLIMGENFMQNILRKDNAENSLKYLQRFGIPPFFMSEIDFVGKGYDSTRGGNIEGVFLFLGMDVPNPLPNEVTIRMDYKDSKILVSLDGRPVGEVSIEKENDDFFWDHRLPGVNVWLPREQEAFPLKEKDSNLETTLKVYDVRNRLVRKAKFLSYSKKGLKRNVIAVYESFGFVSLYLAEGQLFTDAFYYQEPLYSEGGKIIVEKSGSEIPKTTIKRFLKYIK